MKKDTPKVRAAQGYPVYRPTISKILTCRCGVRYIKTRDQQESCIKCSVGERDLKAKR